MAMILILVAFAMLAAVVVALVSAAKSGGRSTTPYQGQAPHRGPVMRFTGTSSQVKDDSGDQKTTKV